nr:hypothetical protein [Tanacetum cinerariifolium]
MGAAFKYVLFRYLVNLVPEWLKLVPEEERPETPEPDWAVPLNDLPEPENNWANELGKTQIGKKKLSKADLEGPAFKVVKAFQKNIISLQFQTEECRLLLTDQVDLVNPEGHQVIPDVSKPLPLGGPTGQVRIKMELPRSRRAKFVTACSYLTDTSKEIMKAQVYGSKLLQL